MYDISVIRRINILYLVVLVTPLIGCGVIDSQEARQMALKEGLEAAEARGKVPAVSGLDLTRTDVLVDLMTQSIGPRMSRLGPLAFDLTALFELTADDVSQVKIEDTVRLQLDEQGRFFMNHGTTTSALDDRSRADGRRCWWVDGQYFVGRLHGPATQVPINGDEQNVCLESSLDPLRGFLGVVGGQIAPGKKGQTRVEGRAAEVVTLTLRAEDVDAGLDLEIPLPQTYPKEEKASPSKAIWGPRALLASTYLKGKELEGEVWIDDLTGVPLGANVKGMFTLEKGDKAAVLSVSITLDVSLNEAAISPPTTDRHFTARQRIFADRAFLMGQKKLPGKGKKPKALPTPGDAPKLILGPGGDLVAAPQKGSAKPGDDLPKPGDAPKLLLAPNGHVESGSSTQDAGASPAAPVLAEDAPEAAPSTPEGHGAQPAVEGSAPAAARPAQGPPTPPKKSPMGPPAPGDAGAVDDEDKPL